MRTPVSLRDYISNPSSDNTAYFGDALTYATDASTGCWVINADWGDTPIMITGNSGVITLPDDLTFIGDLHLLFDEGMSFSPNDLPLKFGKRTTILGALKITFAADAPGNLYGVYLDDNFTALRVALESSSTSHQRTK